MEIVRDTAISVNSRLGNVLKIPEALIQEKVMTLPGLDGRKMSKNYRNTIPIFADPGNIRRQVVRKESSNHCRALAHQDSSQNRKGGTINGKR